MKKYFLFAGLILLISSCSKVLNTQPLSTISASQAFSSTNTALDFVYNVYSSVLNYGWATANGNPDQTSIVDAYTTNNISFDAIYGSNDCEQIFSGTLTNNNDPDVGWNDFSEIRQCNLIIDNVEASSGISASDKAGLIAQGYFLRALCNYYTARAFGKIIWIDTVLDQNEELRLPTVASPAQSWHYVIQDLESAIAGLPATSSSGLANKYVAEAFLSEACLEAEAYSNYPQAPTLSPSDSLLNLAISSAQTVINSGQYSMDPNYAEMFNGGNPNSSEIIFSYSLNSINTDEINTPMQSLVLNQNNARIQQYGGSPLMNNNSQFESWCVGGPSQNLANDYLVIDQNNPSEALQWDQTSQFKAAVSEASRPSLSAIPHNAGETDVEYGTVNPGSGQSVWTLTNVGRDARWAASILSDSTVFQGQLITTNILGNAGRWMKIDGIAYYLSLTNLYWNKNIWPITPNYFYTNPTNYSYVIMRLGRVYLNLAEAYLLKGDVPDGVAALNETRTIHGKLPASTASTLTAAWTDYERERRVDLTLENDYYWSLLRWGMYGGPANYGNPPMGDIPELDQLPEVMDISQDRMKYVIVQGSFFGLNNIRHFDYPRRYLFPISESGYIFANSNIVQNSGW